MTVGLERTVTLFLGENVYHITSAMAVFAFIIAFGLTKALFNLAHLNLPS